MRLSEPIAIIVIICLLLASALIVLDILSFVELKKKRRMTEEAREALMRLTMCAREECRICKYEKECNYDMQCELATKNMQIVLNALEGKE